MIRAGCVTVFVIVALRTEFVNKSKASVIKIIHRNSRQQNLTYFSRRLENSSRLVQSLHRINMKVKEYLQKVLQLTLPKLQQEETLSKEYHEVEQIPPTPGDSWGQHDAMVSLGLCNQAVKNERKNRYCNLFPFDKHIVGFEDDPDYYINASWMQVLPWLPDRRFIVTMAPMHPSSYR